MMICPVLSLLTPSPAPTVTVTETVTPSPPPTIYVKVPDGWDATHDMWLSDFGGALLGALITALLAVGLFLWERAERKKDSGHLRHDREADLARAEERLQEDRRTLLASQLLDGVSVMFAELSRLASTAEMRAANVTLIGLTGRLGSMYGDNDRHRRYSEWISAEGRAVHFKIALLLTEWSKGQGVRDVDLLSYLNSAVISDLIVIEKSTIAWIKDERTWKPHTTARDEWEKNTKLPLAVRNEIPNVPDLDDLNVPDGAEGWLEALFAVPFTISPDDTGIQDEIPTDRESSAGRR